MMRLPILLAVSMALVLSACGEKVQTIPAGGAKKADARAFEIVDNGYLAPGWTPGNEPSWDAQLKARTQAQNDFAPRK
ncbi:MAG: hypothetical protein ABI699_08555 [Caldimonas sp.]